MKRPISILLILSLLMASSPKEWLHWEHEIEDCAAHFQEKCAEEKDLGTCHHNTHFSQVRHECLIMHLSGKLHTLPYEVSEKLPEIIRVTHPLFNHHVWVQAFLSLVSVRGPPASQV